MKIEISCVTVRYASHVPDELLIRSESGKKDGDEGFGCTTSLRFKFPFGYMDKSIVGSTMPN